MASIKMGAIISDARGSVGGTVISRNTGGAYTRARVAPINRRTTSQMQVRQNFGLNSKMWSAALTDTQRQAWTLFGQANPVPNRLGDSIILSGLATFNRLNQVLAQMGNPPLLDPPPDLSVVPIAAAFGATAVAATPAITIETAAQAVSTATFYYVAATGNLAAGRTPSSSGYRYIGIFPGVAAAVALDITSQWTALFGAPIAGNVFGARVSQVNAMTGALTPALIFKGLIS